MEHFSFPASDGHSVSCYRWIPSDAKAVVQIAHGMGEYAARYDWVAQRLSEAGYVVFADDHRGHGDTSGDNLGYMGPDGWNRTLADLYELNCHCRGLYPDRPLCLLGHSMGSMLSQQYITRHANSIDALVLSGSPGFKEQRFSLVNQMVIKFEAWRREPWEISELMQKALFQDANNRFDGPGATGYEWLSRDKLEVQKYVDDPKCGFVLAIGSLVEMFAGSAISQSTLAIEKIPKSLPMYVFAGSDDPIHGEQADLDRMVDAYRGHGIETLDYRFYPGGRHEMFNEINKEEVVTDLIDWLGRNLGGK